MRRVITAICPQCSARLPLAPEIREVVCQYCGTKVLLEKHAPTARPNIVHGVNVVAKVEEQTAAQKRIAQIAGVAIALAACGVLAFSYLSHRKKQAVFRAEAEAMFEAAVGETNKPKGPDALLATKLSSLVFCLDDRAESSRMRYLQWVDAKKGPTGREHNAFGTYSLSLPRGCRSVLDRKSVV